MTSPSVDLDGVLPFGLNVGTNKGTTYLVPEADSNRTEGSFILLPTGPCQVQFTWPGKQDAYVRWLDSANNEKGIPIEISGGVFPQDRYHWRSPRRQAADPCQGRRRPGNHGNYRRLPQTPITTGVVKHDHTSRSTGRDSALRDSLQDGQRVLHGRRAKPARFGRVFLSTRRCVPNTARLHGAGGRRSVVEARRIRRVHNQDVSDSRRRVRGAAQLQTANHPDRRGRAVVDYHDPAPERRRPVHIHRIPTHLPVTQLAAGVV